MKSILLSLTLMTSSLAMACPDLEGSWSCNYTAEEVAEFTLSQHQDVVGNTVYVSDGEEAGAHETIADGNLHVSGEEGNKKEYTATCLADNTLKIVSETTYSDSSTSLISRVDSDTLSMDVTYSDEAEGDSIEETVKVICKATTL